MNCWSEGVQPQERFLQILHISSGVRLDDGRLSHLILDPLLSQTSREIRELTCKQVKPKQVGQHEVDVVFREEEAE